MLVWFELKTKEMYYMLSTVVPFIAAPGGWQPYFVVPTKSGIRREEGRLLWSAAGTRNGEEICLCGCLWPTFKYNRMSVGQFSSDFEPINMFSKAMWYSLHGIILAFAADKRDHRLRFCWKWKVSACLPHWTHESAFNKGEDGRRKGPRTAVSFLAVKIVSVSTLRCRSVNNLSLFLFADEVLTNGS